MKLHLWILGPVCVLTRCEKTRGKDNGVKQIAASDRSELLIAREVYETPQGTIGDSLMFVNDTLFANWIRILMKFRKTSSGRTSVNSNQLAN
jgi:hypothetical protein